MRRIFLLIGLLATFSITIFAKHIDQNTAMRAGQAFLQHSTKTLRLSAVSLDLVYKSMPSSGVATALPPQTTYFSTCSTTAQMASSS